ncbi:carbamoyltransferase N-terminal domain-containing protein [Streptomyces virginiae]|uniref:carbamoyltransferase N-terminal domain-containing protein n=1 Tax=Streptomyces virginiae TaxID=1961 RepID=UPI003658846E
MAAAYCVSEAGITLADLDEIAIAFLVVDGSGDGVSATLAHGTADGLKVLRQFPFSQSLGWFYETVAEHLGLGNWTSSGKLMGLADYGNPDRYTLDFLTARARGSSRRR